LKDVRRDDLVHAVRVVAAGESLLASSVTRRLIADLIQNRPRTTPAARLDVLTSRERETLVLLGRGLSNVEIATAMTVSEHTVKTHVSNTLAKLGLWDLSPDRCRRARAHLVHCSEFPRGGHFAAMEAPDLLIDDIRTFFRTLR
jgi:DNA-binding NarL/FixJ family response regulator